MQPAVRAARRMGLRLSAPAGYLAHLAFAILVDSLEADLSALDLHRRALLAVCGAQQSTASCLMAPTLMPHEHILLWLQVAMALSGLVWLGLGLGLGLAAEQQAPSPRREIGAALLLTKFAATALFAAGNLVDGGGAALAAFLFAAAVAHGLALPHLLRAQLRAWAAGPPAPAAESTLAVFVVAVDLGICAVKAAGALCTLWQMAQGPSAACGREASFVLAVSACAAALVTAPAPAPAGGDRLRGAASPHNQFGQFVVIPLLATLCSVDATSTCSPQVVAFCGVVSSGVVIAAGANFTAVLGDAAGPPPPSQAASASPLYLQGPGPSAALLGIARRPVHPKAF
jgi:hypothetical protein